jgi:glycosyltransferase involved in cell wall biosynthesis
VSDPVPDLVVLSHLRWCGVWQRPQHLMSRLARLRAAAGARTWFVEEPMTGAVAAPRLEHEDRDGITRVWLVVPADGRAPGAHVGFGGDGAEDYDELVAGLLQQQGRPPAPDVWLYTPMALDIAERLEPARLVYDVMDDLASFLNAPEGLALRQRRTLAEADVVFAGGRSLHAALVAAGRADAHLFPSGVETAHYERSRALRRARSRKVAGYVGVIDERLDLRLLADLAAALPQWTIRVVGPVVKIDPSTLPQSPNLEYPGLTAYKLLPEVMAGFDVALMPFALNQATRSISPTKTLEYLAAGLPVVSTRVPDVVADYRRVVHLADDGPGFAAACREVVRHSASEREQRVRAAGVRQEWDVIAQEMAELLDQIVRDGCADGSASA